MAAFFRLRIVRDLGVALIVVFGVGSIAMLLAHVSPVDGFAALFDGAFGTTSEFAETLVSATALLFPALGIALAFRAGARSKLVPMRTPPLRSPSALQPYVSGAKIAMPRSPSVACTQRCAGTSKRVRSAGVRGLAVRTSVPCGIPKRTSSVCTANRCSARRMRCRACQFTFSSMRRYGSPAPSATRIVIAVPSPRSRTISASSSMRAPPGRSLRGRRS